VDTLTSINVFRQVVESGSFVAAAVRLSLSTAMISKHIMHIEKRLGTRLLNRNSRSLSLTEAGSLYLERCKTVLAALEEAEMAVGSINGTPRGTLRITCPSWFATRQMADMLAAHRRRYPEVVVDVSFEDRLVDLVEEGFDLALRATLTEPPAGLVARRLRSVPFIIAASSEYLQRCGVPKTPEDLAGHDSVMVGGLQAWPLVGPNGKIDVPARVVLRFRSVGGVAHAASAGIGLAPLPVTVIEDSPFKGTLIPVLTDYPLQQPTLNVLYVSRKHVPPKMRTFIDHVVEATAQMPPPQIDLAPPPASIGEAV
jgi:DNA-binding transcriptional LysR family regulator